MKTAINYNFYKVFIKTASFQIKSILTINKIYNNVKQAIYS